jgi:hypothetical protein
MSIIKKLKFRRYDIQPSSYQKQQKSRLISISKSYQSQKGYERELKQRDIEISKEYNLYSEQKEKEYKEYEKYEEKEYKEPHRHQTDTYSFICEVSDRTLPPHLVAFRTEAEDIFGSVEAVHDNYYPDHKIIYFEFVNTFSIEDKRVYNNFGITDKQKEFLSMLGIKRDEIQAINSTKLPKRTASKIISKLNKR